MLVERTGKDGRGEFLVPSPVIFLIAALLFFLSFLSYDIVDFPGTSGEKPAFGHLLRWHVVVWLGMGTMFWTGWNRFMGKEGLLSGKAGRFISKLVVRFSGLVEKRIIFDPSEKAVILVTRTGETRFQATDGGRFHLKANAFLEESGPDTPNPSPSLQVEYRDGKGTHLLLYQTMHYVSARRVMERAAKTLRVPLEDQLTGEERSPDELDRPLWKIPASKPKSLPWPKKRNEWKFRRIPDGFRATLGVPMSTHVGIFVCAALLVGYFHFLVNMQSSIHMAVFFGAAFLGTIAFWWVVLCIPYLAGARTELEIGPEKIRYGMCWLGRFWFLQQSMPTESLEAIYTQMSIPCLVSDDLTILVGGNNTLTREECDQFGKLLRWMVTNTVQESKKKGEEANLKTS